jgi:hypothetical protein
MVFASDSQTFGIAIQSKSPNRKLLVKRDILCTPWVARVPKVENRCSTLSSINVCKLFSIKSCSINRPIPIEERTKKERKQFRFEKQKGLFQLAEYLSPKRIFFFFSFLWRNLRETKDNHGKKFSN